MTPEREGHRGTGSRDASVRRSRREREIAESRVRETKGHWRARRSRVELQCRGDS